MFTQFCLICAGEIPTLLLLMNSCSITCVADQKLVLFPIVWVKSSHFPLLQYVLQMTRYIDISSIFSYCFILINVYKHIYIYIYYVYYVYYVSTHINHHINHNKYITSISASFPRGVHLG